MSGETAGLDERRSEQNAPGNEKQPSESEDLWRRLVEYNPACIAVHNDGVLVYANPAAMKSIGASRPEEVLGKPMLSFIHPDDRQVVVARIRELIASGQPGDPREERMVRLDGTIIDVEVTPIPITYQGKKAVLTVNLDITKRKRAEKALRAASNFMAEIINESPDAIITLDPAGNIISGNKRAAQLFQYDLDELGSMNLRQLLPDKDELELAVKGSFVREFRRKDSSRITLNISTANFEPGGAPGCHIITLKDLSEIAGFKIVPVAENLGAGAREYNYEKGYIYLFDKSKGNNPMEAFSDQVKHNVQGLCITRQNPDRIREKYGLEKTPIIWLNGSDLTTGQKCIKPDNLTGLSMTIYQFMSEAKEGFVLLDGLEYLINRNRFESVLKFIHALNDRVMISNCMVMVCIDSWSLDVRQFRTILAEMREFDKYKVLDES